MALVLVSPWSKRKGKSSFNMGYSPILNWLGSEFQGKEPCLSTAYLLRPTRRS